MNNDYVVIKKLLPNLFNDYFESLDSITNILEANTQYIETCTFILVNNRIRNYLHDVYLYRPVMDHHDVSKKPYSLFYYRNNGESLCLKDTNVRIVENPQIH